MLTVIQGMGSVLLYGEGVNQDMLGNGGETLEYND